MPEAFTTKELAQEVLKRFQQDVPNTTVASLKIILTRFVETGEYLDEIGVVNGEQPTPPLAVQRFAMDNGLQTFEDRTFNQRFLMGISKTGTGQFPFTVDCPNKSDFLRKAMDGRYLDETLNAMWWAWQEAIECIKNRR